MEEQLSIEALIDKLITQGKFSEHDLKRIYKVLCKNTHPDLTGKDHARFLQVQEVYQDALSRVKKGGPGPKTDFDPYQVIYDAGFSGALTPRACLYLCLHRYNTHELYSFRIRSNPSLRERNTGIMKSILYWATLYDPDFIKIFIDMNTNVVRDIKTIKTIRQYTQARRLLIQGMDLFFQYQEKKRASSKKIAEEKLSRVMQVLTEIGGNKNPMIPLARWLLQELSLPPLENSGS